MWPHTWVIPWDKNVFPSKTNEQAVNLFRSSELAIFKVSRRYFLPHRKINVDQIVCLYHTIFWILIKYNSFHCVTAYLEIIIMTWFLDAQPWTSKYINYSHNEISSLTIIWNLILKLLFGKNVENPPVKYLLWMKQIVWRSVMKSYMHNSNLSSLLSWYYFEVHCSNTAIIEFAVYQLIDLLGIHETGFKEWL